MAFVLALPERTEGQTRGPGGPAVVRQAVLVALTHQISNAIERIGEAFDPASSAATSAKGVHEARKALKRTRSTLRLLRRALGKKLFTAESQSFAEVGRAMSATRESQVMDEVLHNLSRHVASEPKAAPLSPPLSPELAAQSDYAEAVAAAQKAWQVSPHPAVHLSPEVRDHLMRELEKALARLNQWTFWGGIQKSLHRGLQRTVQRAQKDWQAAVLPGTAEETATRYHELRKRVKDLYYMSALLHPAQPEFLGDLTAQLDELADVLGDDHDLTTLTERAQANPEEFGGEAVVKPLLALAAARQGALREAAQPLLTSVLSSTPQRLADIVVTGLRDRVG